MRRGEIRLVDFEPTIGSEASFRRPAVIVSNNAANEAVERLGRGVLTVVPLTTNVTQVRRFQVLLPAAATGLAADSKAQAEQVRAVDVQRVGNRVGIVSRVDMSHLDRALHYQLDL